MPVRNLTIYDILAVTIPGSVLLLLVTPFVASTDLIGLPADGALPSLLGDTSLSVGFLIVSYTVGSLIQGIAERPPFSGRRWRYLSFSGLEARYDARFVDTRVYDTEGFNRPFDAQLVRRFENADGKRIVEKAEALFGLSLVRDDDGERRLDERQLGRLYWLVQSYLFTRGIDRAQRWSLLEKFHRGMWVSFVLSAIVNGSGFIAVVALGTLPFAPVPLIVSLGGLLLLVVLLSLVGSVVVHQERRKYGRYWGSALLDDFFTNAVVSDGRTASGSEMSAPGERDDRTEHR